MSWNEDAQKALSVAGLGLHALEAIGPIVKSVLGDRANGLTDKAMEQLAAIGLAVDAVRHGLEGKISIEAVEDEIKHLHTGRQANLDATQAEVDKKFPK